MLFHPDFSGKCYILQINLKLVQDVFKCQWDPRDQYLFFSPQNNFMGKKTTLC
jgi:hypothetical protein